MIAIREAAEIDREAIWEILEPVIRVGDVYALPMAMNREEALAYWFAPGKTVFVAEDVPTEGPRTGTRSVVGTYFICANQKGGGAHVANCGYATAAWALGRGIAGAMCAHSLDWARAAGFRAMQFNFVVSTNEAAVHLWRKYGFVEVGRLPGAFLHPAAGYVDALVMWREL
jgi:ribosomal protein S18 acetylase RimI-like enzyme